MLLENENVFTPILYLDKLTHTRIHHEEDHDFTRYLHLFKIGHLLSLILLPVFSIPILTILVLKKVYVKVLFNKTNIHVDPF